MITPDIIDELFQSIAMRDYLKAKIDKLYKYEIIHMIAHAPIDLRRKLEIFQELAQMEEDEEEYYTYADMVSLIKRYLCELELKGKEMFVLLPYCTEDNMQDCLDYMLFYEYESVLRYIENDTYFEPDCYWHELEKWVPCDAGDMMCKLTYGIIGGKICYVRPERRKQADPIVRRLGRFLQSGEMVSLSTPFQTGDILSVDVRPFHKQKKILVLDGNNVLCMLKDGTIEIANLEYDILWSDEKAGRFGISPIYSAEHVKEV